MKRIIGLLTVLLVAMISLGSFLEKDSVFLNVFLKNFNTTITIVSKQEATHNTIQKLQELAKKNNISFIKEEYVPKNSRYEAQKVKIHIYLDDIAWFKKSFKTISVVENKNGSNAFQDADSINLLTSKKVVLSPFENISKEKVTGDYHIKGLEKDIQQFVDEINQNKVVKTEAVFNKDFIVSSDLTQKQAVLYIIMLFILFISIVFCNFIYNGMLSKELSISVLLGYNKLSLSFKKTFNLLIMPLIIGAGLATGIINYLVKPNNFFGFLVSMKSIFLLMIFTAVVIFLIEIERLYKMHGQECTEANAGETISFVVRGKVHNSFAFVDTYSYSGYLVFNDYLKKNGTTANKFFSNSYFTHSHEESINQVINGRVSAAIVDDWALQLCRSEERRVGKECRSRWSPYH